MILTTTNQKGGTGKSTIATNLAACFARDGAEVLLVDADPQRSALDWRADRPDTVPLVQVIGLPVENLHREIPPFTRKYEFIIVDGGGRITVTARAAVSIADFVIVPTLPSKPDILSTQDFFRQVIEEVAAVKPVQTGILLNMLHAGTLMSRKTEDHVRNLPYPTFTTVLHQYTAYREAFAVGLSTVEHDAMSKAAKEMLALYTELKEILT